MIGRRPVTLRVKKPHRPARIAPAAIAWFADPTRQFRIRIPPGVRRRAAMQAISLFFMVLMLTAGPILLAERPVSVGDGAGEIGRRADLAANGFFLLCASGAMLAVGMVAREIWGIHHRWWIEELGGRGLRIRCGNQTDDIAWNNLLDHATKFGTIEIRHLDGRRIRLEMARPARWAVEARLPGRNRLWSGLFVASLLALVGPVGIGWLWRWLGQSPDLFGWRQIGFLQALMLIFPGLLLVDWWLSKRQGGTETARTDPE